MAVQEAFEDYNHQRIHSSLGYAAPTEFAERWLRENGRKAGSEQIIGGEKCA